MLGLVVCVQPNLCVVKWQRYLVLCQIKANGPARSGLTNPLHVYEYGLDMSIQAERWMTCHNLFDEVLVHCQINVAQTV